MTSLPLLIHVVFEWFLYLTYSAFLEVAFWQIDYTEDEFSVKNIEYLHCTAYHQINDFTTSVSGKTFQMM